MDTSLISHAVVFEGIQDRLDLARQKLHTVFGYTQFLGQQERIIEQILSGGDALAVLPSGAGRSLCYLIPALVLEGVTVVIGTDSPPRDWQPDIFARRQIKAACFDPGLSRERACLLRSDLEQGLVRLLYVSAKDFASHSFLTLIEGVRVALFVVQEAQCISPWPFALRLEYCGLSLLKDRYPHVPILAFSRVADPANRQDVAERLRIKNARTFTASLDRANLRYQVSDTSEGRTMLLKFIASRRADFSGIVFCTTRERTEDVAAWLCGNGRKAFAFHNGLGSEALWERRERFRREEGIILVSTCGNGLAFDKPNVRFVVHLDLPASLDSYYLETGLAGQDGAPAEAWLVYNALDAVERRKSLLQEKAPGELFKQNAIHKLDALLGFCEGLQCRRKVLLSYFGEQLPDNCGNCDHCLSPVPRWDGTQAARKVLATVHLTNQRFGMLHLIEVLVGRKTATALRHGHEQLKVFGCGKEFTRKVWQSIFRQLLANGYLKPAATGFGALRYTERGLSVLKGAEKVYFRGDTKVSRVPQPFTRPIPSRFDPQREHLFQALRERRSAIARANKVVDDLILNDSILAEIVRQKPKTKADLLRIPGVTEAKAARFGQEFLEVLDMFAGREKLLDFSKRD
jgi:ATP-dependent DNA helicase RecQ